MPAVLCDCCLLLEMRYYFSLGFPKRQQQLQALGHQICSELPKINLREVMVLLSLICMSLSRVADQKLLAGRSCPGRGHAAAVVVPWEG